MIIKTRSFEIPNKPIPWKRPGISNGKFFEPQSAERNWFKNQTEKILIPNKSPIEIIITFFFEMPKSWSEKKKNLMNLKPMLSTPDSSNLLKHIEDAGNGWLWEDDRNIWRHTICKLWAKESKTCFSIFWEEDD